MKPEFVPTTQEHVEALLAEPLPYRIRAISVLHDGELLGFGGFTYLPKNVIGAFVVISEKGRKFPVALHRAGLRTMEEAQRLGYRRVVALADEKQEAAVRWLERLGFERDAHGAHVWTAKKGAAA